MGHFPERNAANRVKMSEKKNVRDGRGQTGGEEEKTKQEQRAGTRPPDRRRRRRLPSRRPPTKTVPLYTEISIFTKSELLSATHFGFFCCVMPPYSPSYS